MAGNKTEAEAQAAKFQPVAGKLLQALPSVDELLRDDVLAGVSSPHGLVVKAIREVLGRYREKILAGEEAASDRKGIAGDILDVLAFLEQPKVIPVVNATGVIVHTNLGRSLLAEEALKEVVRVSSRYSNLEFDLSTGGRGHRDLLVRDLITELTGAEDALVVNNNAAAVLLALTALARGREVVVSRGELIEIGGAFRIPDVMEAGGAHLREVGTTNKTKVADYEKAVGEHTALFLKVHPSNYRIVGFTREASVSELATLGKRTGLPVLYDLGSGALLDLAPYGIAGERSVRSVVAEGPDLVTFSGDKLLGGPQGGIVVGRKDLVSRLRHHPLARAVRVDKLTLAALEGTLRLYRDAENALKTIPTLRMLTSSAETLSRRARRLAKALRAVAAGGLTVGIEGGVSRAGGGALPELDLPTKNVTLRVAGISAGLLAERLRAGSPPVIVRVRDDAVLLDPRTILDDEIRTVAKAVGEALS